MNEAGEAWCDVLNVKRGWDRWSGSTVELCGPSRGSALGSSLTAPLPRCTTQLLAGLLSQARTLGSDLQLAV